MNKEIVEKKGKELAGYAPATDIVEMEDGFHIIVDMPGVSKDDLAIDIEESTLTVRGRCGYVTREGIRILSTEFEPVRYERTFTLSDVVDADKVAATLKNGVLNLYLPKAEKAKPRRIEIQAG